LQPLKPAPRRQIKTLPIGGGFGLIGSGGAGVFVIVCGVPPKPAQKKFKKDVANVLCFDTLTAPLRPKGRKDSIVCGPITEFPTRDRIDGLPTSKSC
jgi:hypothetical protein